LTDVDRWVGKQGWLAIDRETERQRETETERDRDRERESVCVCVLSVVRKRNLVFFAIKHARNPIVPTPDRNSRANMGQIKGI
jgi:hypothetical protein